MERILEVFLFSAVFLFAICLIYFHTRKNKFTGTYAAVIFSCILYYLIVPAVLRFSENANEKNKAIYQIVNANTEQIVCALLCVLLFMIFSFFGYAHSNSNATQLRDAYNAEKLERFCKIATWVTFLVGGIAFAVYISAFGGLGSLLGVAEQLRSSGSSAAQYISYTASLMIVPARLITITPVFCLVLVSRTRRSAPIYFLIFLCSLLLSAVFYLVNAGKTGILLFALSFSVPVLYKISKHPWMIALTIAFACIPLLGVLDSLFYYFKSGVWRTVDTQASSYLGQFAYPFSNVLNRDGILEISGLRWGRDFVTTFLNRLPGVNFDASTVSTSFFYSGEKWKVWGGTPNDIITFGYLQLSYLGVAFLGSALGAVCGKLDRILSQIESKFALNVIRVTLMTSFFSMTVNADPNAILMNQIPLWSTAICVLYAEKRRKQMDG